MVVKKLVFQLPLLILISCSYRGLLNPSAKEEKEKKKQEQEQQQEQQLSQEQALQKKSLINSIKTHSLEAFKVASQNVDLKQYPELHNRLWCEDKEIAIYLVQQGVLPQEVAVQDSEMPFLSNGEPNFLPGPLEENLNSGCVELTQFYLRHLSPEDVAKGSLTFDLRDADLDMYSETFVNLSNSANAAVVTNQEYCKKGMQANCVAKKHLEQEISTFISAREGYLVNLACTYNNEIAALDQRLQMQLEFGERTGVASPKTYDALIAEAQNTQAALNNIQNVYLVEFGKKLDMGRCL